MNLIRFAYSFFFYYLPGMFKKTKVVKFNQMSHLIVGLGNPDPVYDKTRHNIGKMFVKHLAKELKVSLENTRDGYVGVHIQGNRQIVLMITKCYMNLSGTPIKKILKETSNFPLSNLIVVHDDLENKLGSMKFKEGGSATGHNGLKSIISNCGDNFSRLRIGIDRPESKEPQVVANYVLTKFDRGEIQMIEQQAYTLGIKILREKQFL